MGMSCWSLSHSACELKALGKDDRGRQIGQAVTSSYSCMHFGQQFISFCSRMRHSLASTNTKSFRNTAPEFIFNV
jgi:hypothetical protein